MSKRQRRSSNQQQLEAEIVRNIQGKQPETKEQKSNATNNSLSKLKAFKWNDFSSYKPTNEKGLNREFFRQEVVELAQQLLGKVLVRKTDKGVIRAVIVETEAYKAPLDKACHAYNNKKTERTKYFWLDGGHLYIYTIYMPTNICLNVVAGQEGEPEAVLIRAVQPVAGIDLVKQLRKIKSPKLEDLCNGPGKVGQCLAVNKDAMNGIDLVEGDLKIVDGGIKGFPMGVSRRVNIDYAEEWVDKPWRFYVEGNKYVSKVSFQDPAVVKKAEKKAGKYEK